MPIIVNRAQQVYTGGVYPISAYSRVVSVGLSLDAIGTVAWNYTGRVGNKVWLTHVKIKCEPKPANQAQATAVTLYAGQGVPNSQADLDSWERILPFFNDLRQPIPWVFTDGIDKMEWDLSILYKGKNRRFAVEGFRAGGFRSDSLMVSFTIAEG